MADKKKPQMLAVWSLATAAQKSGGQRDFVVELFGGKGGLSRTAEASGVSMEEVRAAVADAADTLLDSYSVKVGKTLLVWNGRPARDSTRLSRTGSRARGRW